MWGNIFFFNKNLNYLQYIFNSPFRELGDWLHEEHLSHLKLIKSADLDSMGWSAAHYAERW